VYPYPRQFPTEAFQVMTDYYLDTVDLEKKDVIHAGWVLTGYALSKVFGGGPLVVGTKTTKGIRLKNKKIGAEETNNFLKEVKLAVRYGTFDKLEKNNPDCWQTLKSLSEEMLIASCQ
jgi:hypothetical protein